MMSSSQRFIAFISENSWLLRIYFNLLVTLAFSWGIATLYQRLLPALKRTPRVWDDTLLNAIYSPLMIFIWLMSASFIIPILLEHTGIGLDYVFYMKRIRIILFILFIFWFAMLYIRNIENRIFQQITIGEKKRDPTTVRAVSQLLRIVLIVIIFLFLLQTFNVEITSLLAVGGIGGLAIGFAAKDTLSNFIGGLMIFWDRPFSVGDWIRSPDHEVEGTVENIGWRLTKIRTFDKRPLYIPNGIFSTIAIENPSRMSHRRINPTIGLRYGDANKVRKIIEDIETMVRNHPAIDHDQTLQVYFNEFAASSLNIIINAYTRVVDSTAFQKVQQDIFLKVIDIITQHGAECAFPSTTLYVPDVLNVRSENRLMNEVKKNDNKNE